MKNSTSSAKISEPEPEPEWLAVVRAHLGEMRFGSIQIVVHEGRVTQVDATLRTRLNSDRAASAQS